MRGHVVHAPMYPTVLHGCCIYAECGPVNPVKLQFQQGSSYYLYIFDLFQPIQVRHDGQSLQQIQTQSINTVRINI